jgi:dTDP-4-dehydrorhamnose reductase
LDQGEKLSFLTGTFVMRLLITGASGQLGGYLLRELRSKATTLIAWSGSRTGELFGVPLRPVNLVDPDQLAAAFQAARPEVVIHAAGITTVADCFRSPEQARRVNTEATARLTELAAGAGARLLFLSTDLVFDGEEAGYREEDVPAPLSVYGRTKLAAEQAVLHHPRNAVVRTSLLFGPTLVGRPTFFDDQVRALREGRPVTLFADEWRTPLSLVTAAQGVLALATANFTGLLHLGGPERWSRLEMGQRLASFLGAAPSVIVSATRSSVASPEPRPRDVSLDSSRWRSLFPHQPWPSLAEALNDLVLGGRRSELLT